MRKLAICSLALFALGAVSASASLHPDAYPNGTNALGNTVYCVDGTLSTFCLNNVDGPGVGFNDATAAAPIGGNPGTTVGEQRINAYMESFRIWGSTLASTETIWVQGTFQPQACTATSGILGAAGTIQIWANFADAAWPTTWYQNALANKLAGTDLAPGSPDPGLLAGDFADDIVSFFNGNLGTTGCLEGSTWYYGFDANEGATQIDFLQVLTHEVGHGLGFANFVDEDGNPSGCFSTGTCIDPPGSGPNGWPDIYSVFSRENSMGGRHWNQMSDGQRAASAVSGTLVWDGPDVASAAPGFLYGRPIVRAGSPLSTDYAAQPASYSPPPPADNSVSGEVVLWTDYPNSDADPHNVCDAASCDPAVSGKIALVHRGACNFNYKSAVAEFCGAIGVIVSNNAATGLPPMGGTSCLANYGIPCTVPSVGISFDDGAAFEANPGTNGIIRLHETLLAGADDAGFPLLYGPNPVQPGSSVSHWDTTLTPNALMEPFINSDLDVGTTLDLTPAEMTDIGWDGAVHCPVGSDDSATVVIGGCDTGVTNDFGPWTLIGGPKGKGWKTTSGVTNGGCYLADLFHGCAAGTANHGDFNSCADNAANQLRKAGAISASDADAIKACAETAAIP